jgi:trimeric autotransporter adhesin
MKKLSFMKNCLCFILVILISLKVTGQPLTGTKYIPGDYATIQAAISDLNTNGVGGNGVIFNIAANHTEILVTSTSGLITTTGSASDTIIFRKDPNTSGNNPKITAFTPGTSTSVDGMIILAGGDYITFDGIDLAENSANTNVTKMMEWGYALVKKQSTAPFNGCQHVTIRNCTITLNKINKNSAGIYAGNHVAANTTSLTLTATTDAMNDAKIYNNTISNVYQGIALKGYGQPYPGPYTLYDHNNRVGVEGDNHISNFGNTGGTTYAYGIFATCQEYLQVANNVINGGAGTNSTVYGIYLGGSYDASADVFNNDISISCASGSPLKGIYVGYGGSVSSNTITIHDNSIHDCSYSISSSGTFFAIDQTSHTTTANIYNNHIYNNIINTSGGFYGIEGMNEQVTYLNIYGNQIHDNQISGGQGNMYCIFAKTTIVSVHDNLIYNNSIPYSFGTGGYPAVIYGYYNYESPTEENYYNNSIHDLSVGGTATAINSGIFGIYTKSAGTSVKNIYSNDIHSFILSTTGGGTVTGIKTFGGNTISIYNNDINDLQADSLNAMSYGIHVQSGTTVNLYNNMISDLRTPQSYYGSAIKGFYLEGGSNLNLYYNTVFLNATSSTILRFGSAGILTSASPTLDLRNNLIINLSTPVHIANNAYSSAYVRTSPTLSTYAMTSNNNCFYAGTPGTYQLIFWDGGSGTDSTIAQFQARVSPRDSQSISEDAPFLDGTTPPYDLHLNTSIPTGCESGAYNITSFTDDYDGDVRQGNPGYTGTGTAPDIGADEFEGIPVPPPAITWTGAISTAWNDSGNWDSGLEPGISDSVIIPSNPVSNRFPVVSPGVTANCYNIILQSGANVQVMTGGILNVLNP